MKMITQAKSILKSVFGYDSFRPLQENIICNVLDKRDTLVIMPTGGGKSICYQIPSQLLAGLTVVVSPLISLMKDQVEQLEAVGITAVVLNSSLTHDEYAQNMALIRSGDAKLLYVAPETLLKESTLALLERTSVSCLTIDEAHCISEWGHDFRPEYRRLKQVRAKFPSAVCIALTATATPRVRKDIKENLSFSDDDEFLASFNRENLFLEIATKAEPYQQTIDFLKKFRDQSGIIYCLSRKQVDELSAFLQRNDFSVRPYHAGLAESKRSENQEFFIRDDVQIIVATVAFGMGINKPNVRFVIHFDLPKNIEHYYQEIGRAGRDGLPAHCLMLFGYGDIRKVKYFISQMSNEQEQRIANIHLNALLGLVETDVCRRKPLLNYFGEAYDIEACDQCDNCTTEKQPLVDLTEPAQKFLSCVKRTGERFGAGHVIDVLRGSESQKVLKFNHQRLTTYGIGMEFSKKQWTHLSRQFQQKGLLDQDPQYGNLKLTHKALTVLRGHEVFMGMLEADTTSAISVPEPSDLDYDAGLFELLRQTRKDIADDLGVPPYVVFPDKTLMEMAYYCPQSEDSLLYIHGVGTTKAKRFGQDFIRIITIYSEEHGFEERAKPGSVSTSRTSAPSTVSTKKKQYQVVGEAFNEGKSVRSLMSEHDVKIDTILRHLEKYSQEFPLNGSTLINDSRLDEEDQQRVLGLFKQLGAGRLRAIYDALDGEFDYDELKLLQLYWLHG
jgi:ATP-dependent DNA helicase RecQ